MALNLKPELIGERALQGNLRAIERHLNDDHYVRGLSPSDFVPTGTAFLGASTVWPVVALVDAATNAAYASFRKPSEWRTGKLALTLFYSGGVNSTNPARVLIDVGAQKTGEVLDTTLLLSSVALLAGPAVALTILKSGPTYTMTSFGGDDELFSVRIQREGAHADDTYAGNFLIVYLTVTHIPAVLEAQ